jgi:hypothetical protein
MFFANLARTAGRIGWARARHGNDAKASLSSRKKKAGAGLSGLRVCRLKIAPKPSYREDIFYFEAAWGGLDLGGRTVGVAPCAHA